MNLTRSISALLFVRCYPAPPTKQGRTPVLAKILLRIIVPNDLVGNDEASVACLYAYFAPLLSVSLSLSLPPSFILSTLPLLSFALPLRIFRHCLNTILSFTN